MLPTLVGLVVAGIFSGQVIGQVAAHLFTCEVDDQSLLVAATQHDVYHAAG